MAYGNYSNRSNERRPSGSPTDPDPVTTWHSKDGRSYGISTPIFRSKTIDGLFSGFQITMKELMDKCSAAGIREGDIVSFNIKECTKPGSKVVFFLSISAKPDNDHKGGTSYKSSYHEQGQGQRGRSDDNRGQFRPQDNQGDDSTDIDEDESGYQPRSAKKYGPR